MSSVPNWLTGWVSASYMMASIGIFMAAGSLWAITGLTSTMSIFARDFILMIGVGFLMYGIGIRDGINRVQTAEEHGELIDADPSFTFPPRSEETSFRIRHFGVIAMGVGVFMYLLLRDSSPVQATFWLSVFLLYGATIIGFDLGIKRTEDATDH